MQSPLAQRAAGVLLHLTSLPGPGESGDLGENAYRFVDFLAAAGYSVWQILPLAAPAVGDLSPYHAVSAFAGNGRLISVEALVRKGWLAEEDLLERRHRDRHELLTRAHEGFRKHATAGDREAYDTFKTTEQHWLDDYTLFMALKRTHGGKAWVAWPEDVRDRHADAMEQAREELHDRISLSRFEQFVFFEQWRALHRYATSSGIRIFGDLPLFVAHDSADVWVHRQQFLLDDTGAPTVVAGVPPDYFSSTGQRWGNPLYDWKQMGESGFDWWRRRVEAQLSLMDLIRIDHFRGLESYWEIPADEETAVNGRWVKAPGDALLEILHAHFDPLPVLAEDLGDISPAVEALREKYRLPGMKVLQFAFEDAADNIHRPHNHEANFVVYTGTHDNNTTLGWLAGLSESNLNEMLEYLGRPSEPMPWPLIRAALASVARLAVIPMQDLLGLDGTHRMNTPGTSEDNWRWRFAWDQVPEDLPGRLRRMLAIYGRLPEA